MTGIFQWSYNWFPNFQEKKPIIFHQIGGFESHSILDYNEWNTKKWRKKSCSQAKSNPGILVLSIPKPACYLLTTLLHTHFGWILILFNRIFLVLNVCSFLQNFFIIDFILMDSFVCNTLVSILMISPYRLAPPSVLPETTCINFLKLHILQWHAE